MIRVGMIGFGGIAQSSHLKPYLELEAKGNVKIVAVCDVAPEKFEKKVEINIGGTDASLSSDVRKYTDWHEMLEKEELDMVDICVPTYLHKEVTIGALESGVNVLCEKPMSLNYDMCMEMCETAKRTEKKLMIGQCLRFAPAYVYLKKLVDEGTYGKVKSCIFQRLSHPPVWGWDNWFMDYNRSGGCALDLHIHDIDMARYIWGNPKEVSCCTADVYSKKDIAHSRLMYDDFSVMAIGDWTRKGLPFSKSYSVAFEKATVVYNGGDVNVYPRDGEEFSPELDSIAAHKAEIEYFVECIEKDNDITGNIPEDSALSVKLISALIESSDKNGEFVDFITE
jgi:predicted dehydrogenase